MANGLIAILLALVALWLAFAKSGDWERRRQVLQRLQGTRAVEEDERNLALAGFSSRLTRSAFLKGDFQEMYAVLRSTGRTPESIQNLYLMACWAVPLLLIGVGFIVFGFIGAFLGFVIGFIGSRRALRRMAISACYVQNLEAVEFAQVLRMLLEAGLSIERAFRIAAQQARPLIPHLAFRLDRFNRLMDSGAERGVALDDIGEGELIPVFNNLTRLLKQAGALGGSITESLEQLIREANDIERSRIKEQVNKLGAKMTVVMMAFMLPALFLLIGGPAAINIVQALSR